MTVLHILLLVWIAPALLLLPVLLWFGWLSKPSEMRASEAETTGAGPQLGSEQAAGNAQPTN